MQNELNVEIVKHTSAIMVRLDGNGLQLFTAHDYGSLENAEAAARHFASGVLRGVSEITRLVQNMNKDIVEVEA